MYGIAFFFLFFYQSICLLACLKQNLVNVYVVMFEASWLNASCEVFWMICFGFEPAPPH